jgi:O-acetyl-ADP-ribose deacetylase (regulator of RNase III)
MVESDLAILEFFGVELMDRIQAKIIADFLGEQPVGSSFIIETGNKKHPFLAHTPTMRVPMPIATTDYVYSAMWAMLVAVHQHNKTHPVKIKSVACPGLGTATGKVPLEEAARQMALAYRWSLNPAEIMSWPYALNRQTALGCGGDC